jgi:hypothetical protein
MAEQSIGTIEACPTCGTPIKKDAKPILTYCGAVAILLPIYGVEIIILLRFAKFLGVF